MEEESNSYDIFGEADTDVRYFTSDLKTYVCDVCGRGFSLKDDLDSHKQVHSEVKPYQCSILGKGANGSHVDKTNIGHENGLKIKIEEGSNSCDIHEQEFSDSSSLNKNSFGNRIKTLPAAKSFPCDTCGNRFNDRNNFHKHKQSHTEKKQYICDTCEKGFTMKRNLDRHKRKHTGEKPYICNVCGKGFNKNGSLNRHKRIHTGEKPYICDKCGKGFSENGKLKIH